MVDFLFGNIQSFFKMLKNTILKIFIKLLAFIFLIARAIGSTIYSRPNKAVLVIESGSKGWEILEYKELFKSAAEYLNQDSVIKLSIIKEKGYITQIKDCIKTHKPSHYLYDSRTGNQNSFLGFLEAMRIGLILSFYNIIPICTLTDFPVTAWKIKTAIVSARKGIVTSLMHPKDVHISFPHKRLIGPQIMALSQETFNKILKIKEEKELVSKYHQDILFSGSLYEPRKTIFEEIESQIKNKNITYTFGGKLLGEKKSSDEEYWKSFIYSKIVITTANQLEGIGQDFSHLPHLIYRYLEVLACGSVLCAQKVPGVEKYFQPDKDFIAFKTPEEAIKKILHYLDEPEKLSKVANNGYKKATYLINARTYWLNIDNALYKDSML